MIMHMLRLRSDKKKRFCDCSCTREKFLRAYSPKHTHTWNITNLLITNIFD